MAILTIPKEHQRVIAALGELEPAQLDALLSAMKDAPPSLQMGRLSKQIAENIPISETMVGDILSLVGTLYGVANYLGQTEEATANDVIETIKSQSTGDLSDLDEVQIAKLTDFFHRALTLYDSLGISAKAQRVTTQYERVFLGSEIFTDVRTVFKMSDSEVTPAVALINHSLKIDYRQDGEARTLYLALDSNDLLQLRETIDRATIKQERLSTLLSGTELVILKLEGDK